MPNRCELFDSKRCSGVGGRLGLSWERRRVSVKQMNWSVERVGVEGLLVFVIDNVYLKSGVVVSRCNRSNTRAVIKSLLT